MFKRWRCSMFPDSVHFHHNLSTVID
jgi:hypothetical protein